MKKTVIIICTILFVLCSTLFLYDKYKEYKIVQALKQQEAIKQKEEKEFAKANTPNDIAFWEKQIENQKLYTKGFAKLQTSGYDDWLLVIDSMVQANTEIKHHIKTINEIKEKYKQEYGTSFESDFPNYKEMDYYETKSLKN